MNSAAPDLKAVFAQAAEIASPAERAAYLDEACGEDAGLRAQIDGLLAAAEKAGSFMRGPAVAHSDTERFPPVTERPGTVIGPYRLLQQIGEGGMGVVFMAEQTEPLQRTVALKIIKPGMDTRQVIARFEAERQAVAMMDHPNIAKVLDAGATDSGRPYFVMELVKGVPITKYCDEKHLPLRARLELFTQVCQAVQHAHQKGIIHRDIKPNNVLVAEYDNQAVPKVIDFGVAKATAQKLTERTMFTEFGQLLGTMEYMSPEQSKFNQLDVDTRSDVYSLGVLLYELLAGSTPFEGKRLHAAAFDEMLRIIREEEPPKPSTRLSSIDTLPSIAANRHTEPARLSKDVRGELDWIVMKALEKDRNRRYETASGFAADIERHLHDQPVEAGPPSAAYRFRKFAKRNKGVLITTSGVVVGVVAALVALAVINMRITAEKHQKDIALQEKAVALGDARQQANNARAARVIAERQRDAALENLYFAHMHVAHQDWHAGQLSRMRDLLEFHIPAAKSPDLRGWEWYYLLSLAHRDERTFAPHTDAVRSVAFSPDGQRLASASEDRTIRICDVQTAEVLNILHESEAIVHCVAWSRDGKQLASGDSSGNVIVWDIQTGTKVRFEKLGSAVLAIAWAPDGQRIAAAGIGLTQPETVDGFVRHYDGFAWIWDSQSGKKLHTLVGKVEMLRSLAWSPDGKWLASGANWEGQIQIWNASTGELAETLKAHGHIVGAMAWSPDGRQFASGSLDRSIKFWEVNSWKNLRTIDEAHRGIVQSLSWSGDGKQIASAGEDGLVKIWDASTGQDVTVLRGHTESVTSVDWRRQDGRLISGSLDGTVKLWNLAIAPTFRTIAGYEKVAWSPDGRLLAARGLKTEGQPPSIDIFDAASGRKLFDLPIAGHSMVGSLAWSPDGQKLAAALARPGKVVIWDLATRKQILSELAHGFEARSIAWNPDSRFLASAGLDQGVHVWDIDASRKTFTYLDHGEAVGSAVWSPDGKRIASRGWSGVVKIWDPKTGHTLLDLHGTYSGDGDGTYSVSWSPGGDRLAVGCYPAGEMIVWDTTTGHKLLVIRGHTSLVRTLAWSPDGKRLASGGHDRYLKIWDANTGRELLSLPEHRSRIGSVVWSPDGQQIATADHFEVKIWDASIGYRLAREWETNAADKNAAKRMRSNAVTYTNGPE